MIILWLLLIDENNNFVTPICSKSTMKRRVVMRKLVLWLLQLLLTWIRINKEARRSEIDSDYSSDTGMQFSNLAVLADLRSKLHHLPGDQGSELECLILEYAQLCPDILRWYAMMLMLGYKVMLFGMRNAPATF